MLPVPASFSPGSEAVPFRSGVPAAVEPVALVASSARHRDAPPRFVARRPELTPPGGSFGAEGGTVAPEPAPEPALGGIRASGGGALTAPDLEQLGSLAPFALGATDVFVNGEHGLWVDTGDGLVRAPGFEADEPSLRELAVRLIALGGRHIDEAAPCVDVRLRGGIRVHAVLPPISTGGTLLSVRIPSPQAFSLRALEESGMLGPPQAGVVRAAVAARHNLLITGAGGSGNTTWHL
ncbi:ATPase, T2SS/T4P/T4SS family [Compostimonas suwonensis]|uniref:Type II/IV secretion system protein n=1 Tax=Compostimonas suwonensis TaxID=1048394 RepID=A0A2M9BC48_9MICO|nr:ATPase, T2SS/T4P/T4SS family [Compostimonas suwonensis]PJJ55519.1 type II/IV secretion system protein [Compostimonas suwonensis]